jgi:B9 domain-containing protein 2
MRSSNPEPFLINAAANASSSTASTNQRRSAYVRRGDREQQTTNADNNSSTNALYNDDRRNTSGGALGNLRRRYQRRSNASTSEPDEEEGARIDTYSPLDKAEILESNDGTLQTKAEGSDSNMKEPSRYSMTSRHSSLSTTQSVVDDMTMKKTEERKTQQGDNNNNIQLPIINQTNYIRKPDEKLREKFKNIIRSPADGIPEVHILGEISEGIGFKADKFISCKWYLEWGKAWSLLAGDEASQTQYAASSFNDNDGVQEVVWNHPIDVHFATASMQGWPRIIMQLCELDDYGRSVLSGYGFTHLPTNPGYHELEIHCWRPSGSVIDELNAFFLGTSPCLADEKIIFGKAWETRSKLNTVASGIVKLNVHVLLRFFNEQKVA